MAGKAKQAPQKGEFLKSPLRIAVETFYDVQKLRIAVGNRLVAMKKLQGLGDEEIRRTGLHWIFDQLKTLEEEAGAMIAEEVERHPLWENYLRFVKGIGPTFAGALIGIIHSADRFDTISKLWAYAGYAVSPDGRAVRRRRGERLRYNPKLKTLMWKIAVSWLKAHKRGFSFYGHMYEVYKRIYQAKAERGEVKNPTPLHIHYMAMRRAIKLFLSHLWLIWRLVEGLPIRPPYVVEKLGHKGFIRPVVDKPEVRVHPLWELARERGYPNVY